MYYVHAKTPKNKNLEYFCSRSIIKVSDSRQDAITKAKKRFDEFCTENFNLDTNGFVNHIKSLDDDQKDNEIFEVLQSWIDWLSDEYDLSLGSIKGEVQV